MQNMKKKNTTKKKYNFTSIVKKKHAEKLYNYFLNELEIDVAEKRRNFLIPEYRSLFNTILTRKHKFRVCEIQRFYKEKGSTFVHHSVLNSLSKFKMYSDQLPELKMVFDELFPIKKKETTVIKLDRRELTPLQKLVDNLPLEREKEIEEMIKLRMKSWEWKSRDRVKVFESSQSISNYTF